jgi:DNA-binding HxlR family transcriptional regulator
MVSVTMATPSHEAARRSSDDSQTTTSDDTVVAQSNSGAPAALRLLKDEYAREILQALTTGPMRGRDLIEICTGSRPTVYRRLNRLEDAGYVTTDLHLNSEGHHCKQFQLARDTLRVAITDGNITVSDRPSPVHRA